MDNAVWKAMKKQHPNFLLIYAGNLLLFGIGAMSAFGPSRWFSADALEAVNNAAPPEIWSMAMAVVAVGLFIGLFSSTFWVPRLFLAAGFMVATMRSLLLISAVIRGESSMGLSFAPWVFVAICMAAQTLESPSR